jgi:hypothetical protein
MLLIKVEMRFEINLRLESRATLLNYLFLRINRLPRTDQGCCFPEAIETRLNFSRDLLHRQRNATPLSPRCYGSNLYLQITFNFWIDPKGQLVSQVKVELICHVCITTSFLHPSLSHNFMLNFKTSLFSSMLKFVNYLVVKCDRRHVSGDVGLHSRDCHH